MAEQHMADLPPHTGPDQSDNALQQKVFDTLRTRVLYGELPPGAVVTLKAIADEMRAGLPPVREALRRLIEAGALQAKDSQWVSVPVLSCAALEEIEHMRLSVEPELARRAARHAQGADLALLTAVDRELDAALSRGDVPGYLAQNHAFHAQIYRLAKAPILADLADTLWLRFGPSMRVICTNHGAAGLPDMHKDILTALTLGDGDAAASAMAADVAQGMALLKAAGARNSD